MDNTQAGVTAEVVKRAMKDKGFRDRLLNNPKGTIEKELNIKLPNINLKVVQESEQDRYLVLPPSIAAPPQAELSDDQLEKVAAGAGCFLTTVGSSDCFSLNGACCSTKDETTRRDQNW